jgi:outer membrane murein-binding lipoprotein Lpp
MKLVKFTSTPTKATFEGSVITGLALPFNKSDYPGYPKFNPESTINYNLQLPLLLEHDLTKKVGTVVTTLVKEDGIYFVATTDMPADELPQQVSVGGEYTEDEFGNPTNLYIYEISLTNTPAYTDTYTQIVASREFIIENQPQKYIDMENKLIKAQEEVIMQELQVLTEKFDTLNQSLQELTARVDAIEQKVNALTDTANAAMDASANFNAMVNEQIQASVAKILEQLKPQTDAMLEVVKNFIDVYSKK